MDNLKNKKAPKKSSQNKGKMPGFGGGSMSPFTKIANAILIILIISVLYSMIFNGSPSKEQISLSQVASDINAGLVSKIDVKGE